MKTSERGIALLIVVWVLAILMTMALSFSLMTRAETEGTLAMKEGMEQQFLAEAGVERGIMEMAYRSANLGQTVILEGKEVWKTDGTAYSGRLENGGYVVRVIDETGKISLNSLTDSSGIIVKNLLVNLGATPEEAAVIVDSLLDWKDADDLHRSSGAENDYYLSLPRSYRARNGDFESLEELLLVRGMSPALLYGTGKKPGLIGFLTLWVRTNTINLNAAPGEILAALPGMNAEMAAQIVQHRSRAEIRSPGDIMDIIGGSYALMAPSISAQAGPAAVCTIEASGHKDVARKGYFIRATVMLEGPGKYRYLSYRSPAEITP